MREPINKFQGETSHLGAKGTLQKSKRYDEDVLSQGQDNGISKRSKLKREEGRGALRYSMALEVYSIRDKVEKLSRHSFSDTFYV